MTSPHVFENLKSESDVMDVVRVVQAMNAASNALSKMDFETRKNMVLGTLSRFREALHLCQSLGRDSLLDSSSFLSQLTAGSGAPAKRLLDDTIPTAIRLMDKILLHVSEDLARYGAFFPSTGSVGFLLGWSDPLVSFVRKVPLLFATGNGICLKPSRTSEGAARAVYAVALLWQKALEESGAPAGMFAILLGSGAGQETVGDLILKHPSIKNIHWIGRSDAALTARRIAIDAGKRFYFSGSGRNPAILFAPSEVEERVSDQTLEHTLKMIATLAKDPHGWGPYRPSRLFIHDSVYKKSLECLQAEFQNSKLGDPLNLETDVGPIPSPAIERFQAQLKLALSETGRLVTGGEILGEGLVRPTLIRDLTNCSTLQGEELEGVFLTAASFKYQHEAVKYANTSPLGLAGYVFHPDQEKAKGLASRLEVSRLIVTTDPDRAELLAMPASAVKNSGSGEEGIRATYEQGRIRPGVLS